MNDKMNELNFDMYRSNLLLECMGVYLFKGYVDGYEKIFSCTKYLCNADRDRMNGTRNDLWCDFKILSLKEFNDLVDELTNQIKFKPEMKYNFNGIWTQL